MDKDKNKPAAPNRISFGMRLAAWIIGTFVRTIFLTCRVKINDQSGVFTQPNPTPAIYVNWHNRILFMVRAFPWKFRGKTAALASLSKDGGYAAAYVEHFKGIAVRGSTSRGGFRALVTLRRFLADNTSVCLTPDGPRGPRYSFQPGAVALAEKTGCPIIPISINAPSRWELGGWDRGQIPKPFSSITLEIGAPINIPANLSAEQRSTQTERVQKALLDITDDTTGKR